MGQQKFKVNKYFVTIEIYSTHKRQPQKQLSNQSFISNHDIYKSQFLKKSVLTFMVKIFKSKPIKQEKQLNLKDCLKSQGGEFIFFKIMFLNGYQNWRYGIANKQLKKNYYDLEKIVSVFIISLVTIEQERAFLGLGFIKDIGIIDIKIHVISKIKFNNQNYFINSKFDKIS
ncbi:unnamed protein product [Paramecium sonneborni]|uniref:Uncharacterized protein n=1 Tax=Paramecium sonneborni TaxID=65129 RepID=A0A8S1PQK7_9CILI|nr:unnamed protein product [Paramecium sonneborni]